MVVAALATTALGRTGAAREVAAAVLVAAGPPHVAIEVGVAVDVQVAIHVRIDVGVRVGIDVRIRVHIRVRIEMRIRVDVRVCVDMRIGVDVRVRRSRPAARLVALQRVALISLDVELALRALRRAELALRALHRTLERAPPALELLAQRRVLESNAAAVSGIEMPIIEAVSLGDEIGAIEPIIIDHIDADRAAAGPTAVPAPIVVTPQRRADQ